MGNITFRLRIVISFALIASCWYASRTPLSAQTVSGTILGVVQDPQGASIANADISARNPDTGVVRKTVAGSNGEYRIDSVPAGPYEVSATAPGFRSEQRTGVQVTVGGNVSVNFSLTVGTVSETVEVKGQAAQVDTSSATLGGFVSSEAIHELPLNGRDWLQMAL